MADGTHVHVRSPSRLAHIRVKVRELVWEAQFLARLGQPWPERTRTAVAGANEHCEADGHALCGAADQHASMGKRPFSSAVPGMSLV